MNLTNVKCPTRQSYTCCCCGEEVVNTPSTKFPTYGPIKGSAFVLNDTIPYLFDTTFTSYGPIICFSEEVYTNIAQRKDLSCINLDARFDMTNTNVQNNTNLEMLENMISKKYHSLNGVLPIIKNEIKFKISYNITDPDGGVVHEGEIVTTSLDTSLHFTDIRDRFITTARNVAIDILPSMPSTDVYTINFTTVKAFVNVIDTVKHLESDVNPFYTFANNNTEIRLMNEAITVQTNDTELCIAYCDINKSFCFDASINTRVRITFTAYLSSLIVTGDTSGVWESLYSPTEEVVEDLVERVNRLEESNKTMSELIERQNVLIQKLNSSVAVNTNDIKLMKTQIIDLTNKVNRLEAIPLATIPYKSGIEFEAGQITWVELGELYQVVVDYTASGEFNTDIARGMLVRVKGE